MQNRTEGRKTKEGREKKKEDEGMCASKEQALRRNRAEK